MTSRASQSCVFATPHTMTLQQESRQGLGDRPRTDCEGPALGPHLSSGGQVGKILDEQSRQCPDRSEAPQVRLEDNWTWRAYASSSPRLHGPSCSTHGPSQPARRSPPRPGLTQWFARRPVGPLRGRRCTRLRPRGRLRAAPEVKRPRSSTPCTPFDHLPQGRRACGHRLTGWSMTPEQKMRDESNG